MFMSDRSRARRSLSFTLKTLFALTLIAACVCGAYVWWARKARDRVIHTLGQDASLQVVETPLRDVVAELADRHGIEITLDEAELEKVGLHSQVVITQNLKGRSLRSTLNLVLRDLNLTYLVQQGSILITTPEAAKAKKTRAADKTPRERPLTSREEALLAALQQNISFDFHAAPLYDVVSFCERDQRIHVHIDIKALDNAGMDFDPPVTCHSEGTRMSEALSAALKSAGLTYVIRNETVLITTPVGRIRSGDVVTPAVDGVEMKSEPADDASLVAALPRGAEISVLQVKPPFFRGVVTVAGELNQGWIRHDHVDLPTPADIYEVDE
jgi:hypothetical protein